MKTGRLIRLLEEHDPESEAVVILLGHSMTIADVEAGITSEAHPHGHVDIMLYDQDTLACRDRYRHRRVPADDKPLWEPTTDPRVFGDRA